MGQRVVRARSRLRMVLYREQRELSMANALDGTIVQIHVRHLEGRCSRYPLPIPNYRESMVLSCDQHLAATEVSHRVIPAPMAVRQLGSLASIGQTD
jgi:hypothetical protein